MVVHENADENLMIEATAEWKARTGKIYETPPPSYINDFVSLKKIQGQQSQRVNGNKHFNKVGYIGADNKIVPRWAADDEKLARVIAHQKATVNPESIFGRLVPSSHGCQ